MVLVLICVKPASKAAVERAMRMKPDCLSNWYPLQRKCCHRVCTFVLSPIWICRRLLLDCRQFIRAAARPSDPLGTLATPVHNSQTEQ
jgi:hypothetical protein